MRRLQTPTALGALLGGLLLGSALLAAPLTAAAQEDTLARIRRTATIAIGYSEASPPFSFAGTDGKPHGYSIDLCLRIALDIQKDLSLSKLDIKWIKVTTENRLTSVANGTVDIECGSTTKTLSRMELVDFTQLTFLDGGSLLVTTASAITKIQDITGKRVAVIPGTTTERAIREIVAKLSLQNVTLLGVKDHAEGLAALDDGKIDAYASDRMLLGGLVVKSRNTAKLMLIDGFISYEPYALVVRRGDAAFRLAADRVLIRLYRSAEVVPIYEKWFGPFPAGGSLIPALFVLYSVPE